MAKVMELLSSGDLTDIFKLDCDQSLQDWFYGVGALDSLQIDVLKADMCRPDMFAVVTAEVMEVFDTTNYLTYVRF